jgi:ASPIC and UnbV
MGSLQALGFANGQISCAAIGATVVVTAPGGPTATRQVDGGNGYTDKRAPDLHFGLSRRNGPDRRSWARTRWCASPGAAAGRAAVATFFGRPSPVTIVPVTSGDMMERVTRA